MILRIIVSLLFWQIFSKACQKKAISIITATTAEIALERRRNYKAFRRNVIVIWGFVAAILSIVLDIYELSKGSLAYADVDKLIGIRAIGTGLFNVMLLYFFSDYQKGVDSVSTYTKKKYLKDVPSFALFLRAFEKDLYQDMSNYPSSGDEESPFFIEQQFTDLLNETIPICAVGMTKEAEHAMGATRLYLPDITWKDDVLDLMKRAKHIFILLHFSNSCIWEIEQSLELKEKTFYIIEDKQDYMRIRLQLSNPDLLPPLPSFLDTAKHSILYYYHGEPVFEPFPYTIETFQTLASRLTPQTENEKFQQYKDDIMCDIGIYTPLVHVARAFYPDNIQTPAHKAMVYDLLKGICLECNEICPVSLHNMFDLDGYELQDELLTIRIMVDEEYVQELIENQSDMYASACLQLTEDTPMLHTLISKLSLTIKHIYQSRTHNDHTFNFEVKPEDLD